MTFLLYNSNYFYFENKAKREKCLSIDGVARQERVTNLEIKKLAQWNRQNGVDTIKNLNELYITIGTQITEFFGKKNSKCMSGLTCLRVCVRVRMRMCDCESVCYFRYSLTRIRFYNNIYTLSSTRIAAYRKFDAI